MLGCHWSSSLSEASSKWCRPPATCLNLYEHSCMTCCTGCFLCYDINPHWAHLASCQFDLTLAPIVGKYVCLHLTADRHWTTGKVRLVEYRKPSCFWPETASSECLCVPSGKFLPTLAQRLPAARGAAAHVSWGYEWPERLCKPRATCGLEPKNADLFCVVTHQRF